MITIPGFIIIIYLKPAVGMIALMITNIFGISDSVNSLLNGFSYLEQNFVSWERCLNYMQVVPEPGYTDINKTIDRFNKN